MLVSRPKGILGGATLTILVALTAAGVAMAAPVKYDFEGLAAGTIVWGQQPNGGFQSTSPYPGMQLSAVGIQATNSICVFDTAHPTGGDTDLGTPNQYFGGPGVGIGGMPGMPGENSVAQKKVLIIPENLIDANQDNLVDGPDDNAHGGSIAIQWDVTGILYSAVFIDIEEPGGAVDCYLGNKLVQSFPIQALGDNSQVTVNTRTTGPIDRTVITFVGSGALAALTFEYYVVPTEPTTWGKVKSLYSE